MKSLKTFFVADANVKPMKKSMSGFMKQILLLFLLGFVVLSCKKDKVPPPIQTNYYNSNGNLLILKIDDELEGVCEYNLTSIALNNDSLPLYFETYSDGIYEYRYLKFTPNPDTLIQISSNNFTFFNALIDPNELENLSASLPFDSLQFQTIGNQNNMVFSTIWSKISKLDIVKTYRSSNPTSKIGIHRVIINEYDAQLGFNIPNEKYLILLVK
jgi:hypothetical protein